LRRWSPPTITV